MTRKYSCGICYKDKENGILVNGNHICLNCLDDIKEYWKKTFYE